jgi:hypothetical protein
MLVATIQNLVTRSLCSYGETVRRTDIQADKQFLDYANYCVKSGTAVAQWLRYCTTNRKVAGSIPDGVSGIFH